MAYGKEHLIYFKKYFTGKKPSIVTLKNNDSSPLNIQKGVQQGSILGQLLFILYINNCIYYSDRFEFLMYADDTTLFSTHNKFENIDNKTKKQFKIILIKNYY